MSEQEQNRTMMLNSHMNLICVSSSKKSTLAAPTPAPLVESFSAKRSTEHHQKRHHSTITAFAGGTFSLNPMQMLTSCETCRGKGAIECPGCKGTGKNKKNGNIFERWKCFDCQGFGLKSCPTCGKGRGLTPEQRGER